MYKLAALAVGIVGSVVAATVYKRRKQDKDFLKQMKSLHPHDRPDPTDVEEIRAQRAREAEEAGIRG